jgi:hypothetical protein
MLTRKILRNREADIDRLGLFEQWIKGVTIAKVSAVQSWGNYL